MSTKRGFLRQQDNSLKKIVLIVVFIGEFAKEGNLSRAVYELCGGGALVSTPEAVAQWCFYDPHMQAPTAILIDTPREPAYTRANLRWLC